MARPNARLRAKKAAAAIAVLAAVLVVAATVVVLYFKQPWNTIYSNKSSSSNSSNSSITTTSTPMPAPKVPLPTCDRQNCTYKGRVYLNDDIESCCDEIDCNNHCLCQHGMITGLDSCTLVLCRYRGSRCRFFDRIHRAGDVFECHCGWTKCSRCTCVQAADGGFSGKYTAVKMEGCDAKCECRGYKWIWEQKKKKKEAPLAVEIEAINIDDNQELKKEDGRTEAAIPAAAPGQHEPPKAEEKENIEGSGSGDVTSDDEDDDVGCSSGSGSGECE